MIVFQKMHWFVLVWFLLGFILSICIFIQSFKVKGCFFGILPNMKKKITILPKDDIVGKWCLV
jgi:hypothetical protein